MSQYKGIIAGAAVALLIFLAYVGVNVMPVLILAGLIMGFYFIYSDKAGSVGKLGSVKNKDLVISQVTFDDIGGQESAKRELKEALDFMKEGERVSELGIRPLKGILLTGPPGTGKTLLAKAAATYTDSAFISVSGSAFIEMYAGVGAKRVRDVFARAREEARNGGKSNAIIFIDEIDVLGATRGRNQGHMEYDQTLNQLLIQMDGFSSASDVKVLVMAATNRVDLLDDALLRPGRFDRIVSVDLPDRIARKRILEIHSKGKPIASDVDFEELADESYGFSGAHIASVANEAAIMALRDSKDEINMEDFKEAIEKVMLGEKIDRKPKDEDMKRIAVHEVGHAVMSELSNPGSVAAVTVTSRGKALGFTRQVASEDSVLQTRVELEDRIAMLLGGAKAEELIMGSRSTGSRQDFDQAVEAAKFMVECGLSDMGICGVGDGFADEVSENIRAVLRQQEERAEKALKEHLNFIRNMGELLIERERVSGDEFREKLRADLELAQAQ